MDLKNPDLDPRLVEDYEFYFKVDSPPLQFTIDREAGDTIDFTSNPIGVIVHLSEKPNGKDPQKTIPAEEVTIFSQHVIFVQSKVRKVFPVTVEQQEAFQDYIKSLDSKTRH